MTSRELTGGPLTLGFLTRYRDAGLFLLRVGIGICYIAHGWPKISNPDLWPVIGGMGFEALGVNPGAAVTKAFGFMAAISEFGGAILLILGFLFRPACILMASTMAVALLHHMHVHDNFDKYNNALQMLIVFVSLIFIGPGKISIDRT